MREKVEAALEQIKPALLADGGGLELLGVSDDIVKVRLSGACSGCPLATMTLKFGIEQALKEQIPDIKEVIAV